MINKFFGFLNNNNTYNQTNIGIQNNYTSEVKTLLESLDIHFFNGEMNKAFELLESGFEEHKDKESKYKLLLKKAEYFLELRNIEKVKTILGLLKNDYKEYDDKRIKGLLLSIYSLEKKEEDFFKLVEYLKIEKNDLTSDTYFKMLYYLNSGRLEEVKHIFYSMQSDEQEKYTLIIGHMFSNSYNMNNKNIDDLEKAIFYYKKVLEGETNFFVKLHILGFFAGITVNEYFKTEKYLDNKELIEYKEMLEKFFQAEHFVNKDYINGLKDFKASILITLSLYDEYIEFYEKNQDILFKGHYLQYCKYKKIKINHKIIQKELVNGEYLLLMYANLLVIDKEERIHILNYFNKNIDLLLSIDWVVYFYVLSSIEEEHKIDNKVKKYIKGTSKNRVKLQIIL